MNTEIKEEIIEKLLNWDEYEDLYPNNLTPEESLTIEQMKVLLFCYHKFMNEDNLNKFEYIITNEKYLKKMNKLIHYYDDITYICRSSEKDYHIHIMMNIKEKDWI